MIRLRLGELRPAALGVPRERAAAGHAGGHRRGLRIVLGDGYAAGGVLLKGNVEVTGGLVAP